jgi:pyruvate dehydrogenase E2 component (dihydrolipoamide acetyltransferase)
MAIEFRFPDVGEGIHEGRVVQWLIKEGETVTLDQPLLQVETDKAIVDLPSPVAGAIAKLHAAAGATIHVGDVLVTYGEAGAAAMPILPVAPPPRADAPTTPAPPTPAGSASQAGERPAATPHTRALARKLGVDLTRVAGTGRTGRITDEDVSAAAAPSPAAPPPLPPPRPASAPTAIRPGDPGQEERVPLTHLRRVIADAMHGSLQTAAHVTHVDEADVTDLLALRKRLNEKLAPTGARLTLAPFFVKALVAGLKLHPKLNASFDAATNELVLKRAYHIGLAVDTPEGLIVPVVHDADRLSLEQLAVRIDDLAGRARERRLSLDELRGGTCTLTNIGPVGGLFATPIIHQPELAIVGTHAIKEKPGFVGDEIRRRSYMYVSVSFDHRFIDGAEAARFLADVVARLTDPDRLIASL